MATTPIPIDPKPLTYSPIQASNYTAVEYTIPLTGAAPDLSPLFMGTHYLREAVNMVIRNGRVITREGTQTMGTALSSVVLSAFEYIPHNGSALCVVATKSGVQYYDTAADSFSSIVNSAWTAIDSGANVDWVPMRTASSGLRLIVIPEARIGATKEQAMWWTGATSATFIALTSSVQGNCGITWKSHFLLGDTTDTGDGAVPYRIHWSALGDPTTWFGTASAGSIDLLDKNASPVMRFLPLRRVLMAYKQFGAHSLTYKGDPFWFTQTLESENINILSRGAVCSIKGGDAHFMLTTEGVLLWDGQTVQSIGHNRVDRTIFDELDWAARYQISTSYWPLTKEVYLTYPFTRRVAGHAGYATWVYNVEFDSWWRSTLAPVGMGSLYQIFSSDVPQFVSTERNLGPTRVYRHFLGTTDALTSSTSQTHTDYLITPPLDFGSFAEKRTTKVMTIFNVRPTTSVVFLSTSVQMTFLQTEHPLDGGSGSATTMDAPISSLVPLVIPEVSQHFSSRYLAVQAQFSSTSGQLECGSIVFLPTLRTNTRETK